MKKMEAKTYSIFEASMIFGPLTSRKTNAVLENTSIED